MPLLSFFRLIATWLSLIVLAAAAYLLWSWYQGALMTTPAGDLVRERQDWRLWTGGALLAWSFLGRLIAPLLLARSGARPDLTRGEAQTIVSATGSELYVEHHGPSDAPLLIFTHGWGMDSTFWNAAKRDLAGRFRLVVWDLPGLGKSKLPGDRRVSLARYAEDLAALTMLSGAAPAVLVGHSIGGMIIQTLIRSQPQALDRVSGLVLLNTTYTNPLRTMVLGGLARALQKPVLEPAMHLTRLFAPLVWLSKWQSYLSGSVHMAMRLGFGRYLTRGQLEHAALLSTRASPAVEAKGNLAMFHWDATGALEQLPRSALVIGGDKDIVTKLEASRFIAGENPLATLRVIEGVNHMGPLERADLYNQLIAEFAQSVQPRVALAPDMAQAASEAGAARPPAAPPGPSL